MWHMMRARTPGGNGLEKQSATAAMRASASSVNRLTAKQKAESGFRLYM